MILLSDNKRHGENDVSLLDKLLYIQRFIIERANAWLGAFKAILTRFETNKLLWKDLNIIAFCLILLREL